MPFGYGYAGVDLSIKNSRVINMKNLIGSGYPVSGIMIYNDNNLGKLAKKAAGSFLNEYKIGEYKLPSITKEDENMYMTEEDELWYFYK